MAAGTLPKPGTEYGPCADECKHRDCAVTREMASAKCDVCGESIGYGTRLYQRPTERRPDSARAGTELTDSTGGTYTLVHASCVES